jgi:hypothetical protein
MKVKQYGLFGVTYRDVVLSLLTSVERRNGWVESVCVLRLAEGANLTLAKVVLRDEGDTTHFVSEVNAQSHRNALRSWNVFASPEEMSVVQQTYAASVGKVEMPLFMNEVSTENVCVKSNLSVWLRADSETVTGVFSTLRLFDVQVTSVSFDSEEVTPGYVKLSFLCLSSWLNPEVVEELYKLTGVFYARVDSGLQTVSMDSNVLGVLSPNIANVLGAGEGVVVKSFDNLVSNSYSDCQKKALF